MDETTPDLVEHGQRDRSELIRTPELLHRGEQASASAVDIAVAATVELAEDAEQARELLDRRPPAGLGRVRSHHEAQLGVSKHGLQFGGCRTALCELRDRPAHRPGPRHRRFAVRPPADAAHAVVVLGEVDELKPARERADQHLRLAEIETGDQHRQAVSRLLVAGASGLAEGDSLVEQVNSWRTVAGAHDRVQHLREKCLVGSEVARPGDRGDLARTAHAPNRHISPHGMSRAGERPGRGSRVQARSPTLLPP